MGYKIQPVQTNLAVDNTALGVEINFNGPGVFVPVYSTDQQSLNNLKNLLLTRIGERYDNPTYGTNLLNIIFQPNVEELKSDIATVIMFLCNHCPYEEGGKKISAPFWIQIYKRLKHFPPA